ncbi:MAG TPA: 50S ribosomal protein L29 [bacterium]|nr:50S ribosomal protein L29 [bacterium]
MKFSQDLTNYRKLGSDKLVEMVNEEKNKLTVARLKVRAGKLDNYSQISKIKKNIARIYSVINEQGA